MERFHHHRRIPGPGQAGRGPAHRPVLYIETVKSGFDQAQQAAQLLAAPPHAMHGLVEIARAATRRQSALDLIERDAAHLRLHTGTPFELKCHGQNPNPIWPAGAPTDTPSSASMRRFAPAPPGAEKPPALPELASTR